MLQQEGQSERVLVDARRALEVHGWYPGPRGDGNCGLSVREAIEHVAPMDGCSWQAALVELAERTGLLAGEQLDVIELESVVEAWENRPGRTLTDVLRVLS